MLAQRVLHRSADGVDTGAAALAHPLRAERREGRRALDVAGLEWRHVEGVRDVIVVEVRGEQVAVLVVDELLVDGRTEVVPDLFESHMMHLLG